MPLLAWTAQPDGQVDYWNQGWINYTGKPPQDTQGWAWQQIIHPQDLPACLAAWTGALENGTIYEIEYRLRRADGSYRWHLGRALPLKDSQNQVIAWVGTCTDIHEQKQRSQQEHFLAEASRELARSMNYSTTLAKIVRLVVPDLADWCALSIVDPDQTIRQVEVAHIDPARVELARELNRRYPDHTDSPHGVPQVLRSGQAELVETIDDRLLTQVAQDETHLECLRQLGLVSYMVVPLLARGRTLGALTLINAESQRHYTPTDLEFAEKLAQQAALTVDNARLFQAAREELQERRRIQEALAESEDRYRQMADDAQNRAQELAKTSSILAQTATILEKRNQELDQFAYVVSHDLKAPLRAIANLSQWIEEDLEDSLSPDTRHQMTLMRGRVHRMENLIDGLLQYSRIGRLEVQSEMVDLNQLLPEIIDSLSPPPDFTITLPDHLPRLRTERLHLEQVFANLLSNAIKHHDRNNGKIQIGVSQQGEDYEFSVEDDGPGIDPKYHTKVFGIFQTLEARDKVENTGIGLSIVKKIIESKGGTIHLTSQPGQGTAFHFTWKAST